MNTSSTTSSVLCGLFLVGSAAALAAAPGEQIAKNGTPAGAPACVSCHGATGQGLSAAGFPRLSGMNADYLLQQLTSFSNGTRVNPVMGPIAKLLTEPELRTVSDYYAAMPAADEGAVTTPAAASAVVAGQRLALEGAWDRGMPACAQCHGVGGYGVGPTFPQISGQSATYLMNQIQAWHKGTRKNDPMGLMHGIAIKLTDADLANVAAYYASRPATPPRRSSKP